MPRDYQWKDLWNNFFFAYVFYFKNKVKNIRIVSNTLV